MSSFDKKYFNWLIELQDCISDGREFHRIVAEGGKEFLYNSDLAKGGLRSNGRLLW